MQRVQTAQGNGGRFRKTHIVWLTDYGGACRQRNILAVGAKLQPGSAENLLADSEISDIFPERRNPAWDLPPQSDCRLQDPATPPSSSLKF